MNLQFWKIKIGSYVGFWGFEFLGDRCFWAKNGGVLTDYRFLIIEDCLLKLCVTGCNIKSYGFLRRVYGSNDSSIIAHNS